MDTRSQHQYSQPTQRASNALAASNSGKNAKNISIKEFITARLKRAKSFEGGENGSTKDESTNWFDEFKARMIRKSQAKQHGTVSVEDNNQADEVHADDTNSENQPPSTSTPLTSKQASFGGLGSQLKTDSTGSFEDLSEFQLDTGDLDITKLSRADSSRRKSSLSTSYHEFKRNSSTNCPDFDRASINTILDGRETRIRPRNVLKCTLNAISNFLGVVIYYLFPVNKNLPWKLICFLQFFIVLLIVGDNFQTKPNIKTLTFINGFLCGIAAAIICLVITAISLVIQMVPSAKTRPGTNQSDYVSDSFSIRSYLFRQKPNSTSEHSSKDRGSKRRNHLGQSQKSNEFCEDTSQENENEERSRNTEIGIEAKEQRKGMSSHNNYKGWMVEFLGDYELRNKAEVKLKLLYVKFEGGILYLCKPKNSHDADSSTEPTIIQQRVYNLNQSKTLTARILFPRTVRNLQKWIWSKKYPIKLDFDLDFDEDTKQCLDEPKVVSLTLFAKTCREKEEWFRRFKLLVEARMNRNPRFSFQSDLTSPKDGLGDYSNEASDQTLGSCSNLDTISTSQSTHLLSEPQHELQTGSTLDNKMAQEESKLSRTRSCEVINQSDQYSSEINRYANIQADFQFQEPNYDDDSTLTKATAEKFSQAIDMMNFFESRPNLDYNEYIERIIRSCLDASSTSDWFNALTGRIFFDVFSQKYWSVWFKRKIQRKLYRIRLPYFMETLTLTKIDLGTNAPQFLKVVSHSFDSFGLSIDFDMAYSGGLTMTFATKLDLLKIKPDNPVASSGAQSQSASSSEDKRPMSSAPAPSSAKIDTAISSSASDSGSSDSSGGCASSNSRRKLNKSNHKGSSSGSSDNSNPSVNTSARNSDESSDSSDSDSDSSSESSLNDAAADEISDWEDYSSEKTRQNFVRFVDRIASSRYFQQATENRYIKKKLQDISNCPLVLVVQIKSLNGILTLNVPPPQTDRIWYGFKPNPEITLKALPKMGDREVSLSPVTDWIEKKLEEEFRKILVIPNMEDIILPVLKSDHLLYVSLTKQ